MRSFKATDPTDRKATIVELRGLKLDGSIGMQSVLPPSIHPSGEVIRFEAGCDGTPANVDADELVRAVHRIAASALLAKHWPAQSRHDAGLALCGGLAHAGLPREDIARFWLATYRAVASHDPTALGRCELEAKDSYDKHARGEITTGFRSLMELVEPKVVKAALKWLGLDKANMQAAAGSTASAPDNAPSIFDNLSPYPLPLAPEAFYGIAGRFVRLVEPHTEADPNFLLISFLIHAGNVFGRDAWVWAGGDKHHSNLFGCAVGPTSNGRKGSAASPIRMFFEAIDDEWVRSITSGLSTGEGLITAVRDPAFKREKVSKGRGIPRVLEDVCVDEGVADKRVLVIQSEFYGALQAMKRQGNTLSSTMRDAWDKGDLRTMVKNSPAKATGAHISIIANITRDELLRGMLSDEMDNGFANRILWICSKRSKELPEGGKLWQVDFGALQRDFNRINGIVKGALTRDAEASDDWGYDDVPSKGAYRHLTRERSGMYGAVTARAAAQVLRLSLIYALLDGSDKIRREHLAAALEVWRYCDESPAYIFGDATGDSTADAIIAALRGAGAAGMTRLELTDFFKRNKPSSELNRALLVLHRGGQARFEREQTGGRPTERWFAINGTEGRR